MKLYKVAIIAAMLITTSAANALIIDNGTFTTDDEANLDWLDVTLSVDQSYNYVSSQFGAGGEYAGWRYATGAELNTLVTNALALATPITSTTTPIPTVFFNNNPLFDQLVSYLGDTYDNRFTPLGVNYTIGILSDELYDGTTAMQYFAGLFDYHDGPDDNYMYIATYSNLLPRNATERYVGSFLVRQSVSVPEPATWLLMSLGMLGMVGMKRRQPT